MPEEPTIVTQMRDFKLELFGTHDLFKFHTGFSWFTGFFLVYTGFVMLFSRENDSKKWNLLQLINLVVITTISVIYFHALANGFLISALCVFSYSFFKSQKSLS